MPIPKPQRFTAPPRHPTLLQRGLTPLHLAVLVLAAACFTLACFMPLYTDEVTWKVILGREHWDHLRTITVTMQPSCGAEYAQPTPAVMLPAHWLDTLFYEPLSSPLQMRLWGVGVALLWILIAWHELCALTHGFASRLETMAVLLAWSTLGVMPFLLVLGRPEQALLLGATYLLLRALRPRPTLTSMPSDLGRGVALLAIWLYVLCAHPRALFLFPLAAICLYRSLERPAFRWSAIGASAVLAGLTQSAWHPLWTCDGDTLFATRMAYANIGIARPLGLTHAFFGRLLLSLLTPSGWYLQQFAPKSSYSGNLLPPFELPFTRVLRWLVEAAVLAGLLVGLGSALRLLARWRPRQVGSSRLLVPAAGWFFFLASVLVRVQKHDYEAETMEPLLGLLAFASVWLWMRREHRAVPHVHVSTVRSRLTPGRLRTGAALLLGLSVISQGALLLAYGKNVIDRWARTGQPDGQALSVNVEGGPALEQRVLATAALCGLHPGQPMRHLVVDETSYFAFRDSDEPLFALYFDPQVWSRPRTDPTPQFQKLGSAGWIAKCNKLPEAYTARAHRIGETCCLPAFR